MIDLLGGMAIFSILIVGVVSPLIALFFRKTGFKRAWKTSSIILLAFLLLLVSPILIISHYTEQKPLIEQMDKQYELKVDKLPKGVSTEKIFVEIYQTGSDLRKSYRTVSYIVNNYNNRDFKGKIKISAFYEGEKIGEKEQNLDLLANKKGYHNYIDADNLNIPKRIWYDVTFKYEIKGEFSVQE